MPPKRKRAAPSEDPIPESSPAPAVEAQATPRKNATPRKRATRAAASTPKTSNGDNLTTPTANRGLPVHLSKTAPVTPHKLTTPRRNAADKSARRKSNQRQLERAIAADVSEEDAEDEQLVDEIAEDATGGEEDAEGETDDAGQLADSVEPPGETPVKRGRGRPKGSKNREITPPTDLPAHEWYFWINRPNGLKTSTNTFPASAFLSHSAYHEAIQRFADPHAERILDLHKHHLASYGLWEFEMHEGFNILLHGYGNKMALLKSWADWIHAKHQHEHPQATQVTPSKGRKKTKKAAAAEETSSDDQPPVTIVLEADHPALTIRTLFPVIARAALTEDVASAMPNQPTDAVRYILEQLDRRSASSPSHIYLLISPIHASLLTHAPMPTLLAELSQHSHVHIIAAADDPHFPLIWPQGLKDKYNWVYHDGTTFASFDSGDGQIAGAGVVDTVNELLGRKGARGKGREGVRWVLRSLPESARGVYRIIVADILSAEGDEVADLEVDMDEVMPEDEDEEMTGLDDDGFGGPSAGRSKARKTGRAGRDELPLITYRSLYAKAAEEFLVSSEMHLRGLLKEFVDHQMVTIKRDMSGQEALAVDMRRDELEGVLEDLLLGD